MCFWAGSFTIYFWNAHFEDAFIRLKVFLNFFKSKVFRFRKNQVDQRNTYGDQASKLAKDLKMKYLQLILLSYILKTYISSLLFRNYAYVFFHTCLAKLCIIKIHIKRCVLYELSLASFENQQSSYNIKKLSISLPDKTFRIYQSCFANLGTSWWWWENRSKKQHL